jgi:serine/threonine protein kinase/Tol biopolymer transport system component
VNLDRGTRLGSFEIVEPLGAGAMGAVYKARDTRLDRFVAIKVLSGDLSSSQDARERFEREARTISQISHPHICALYDVGRAGDVEYLVMELLDGETLAARLSRGAVPMAQTLRYAIEMADALHAAHRNGIVHRDLKPANVMLTKSGVKLLDFGLAKATAPLLTDSSPDAETAMGAAQISREGTIAGTLQYMSPEQLEGRPADTRSDIFAFGAVIHEMVTGKKAFTANSPIGLASAILHQQAPSLMSLEPATPSVLDRLVRLCLAKDPDERWQTAHDVKLQLVSVQEEGMAPPARVATASRSASWLPWTVAGASILVALAAIAFMWMRPGASRAAPARIIRFSIAPPPGGAFSDSVEAPSMALSPDGSQLAYVAEDADGERRVWIRQMSSVDARPIAGTDRARTVIWSPDGRSIAFFAGDKLKRLDPPDGMPVTLTDVPAVRIFATWGRDDILYTVLPGGIYRVPIAGGPAILERAADSARGEVTVTFPSFLPDGRRFLYLARQRDGNSSVMVAEIGKPASKVMDGITIVHYVEPGYLVFGRDGTLLAQRFDLAAMRVVGEPFPIAEPVRYFLSTGVSTFTTSQSGVLVYQSHREHGRVVWLDRAGREVGRIGEESGHSRVRIARDGRRVLFDATRPDIGTVDMWLFDAERGVDQQLTTDRMSEGGGVWLTSDTVIFSGRTPPHLMQKDLRTNAEEELFPPPAFQNAEDISPDGKTLLFTQRTPRGTFDMWTMPVNPRGPAAPLVETPFDEWSPRFSPDGRYIAFASDESGRYEVYVTAFPFTGAKTRVTAAGGWLPRWSRDGRELFYLSGDLRLVAMPVRLSPTLVLGAPQPLFAVKRATEWVDTKPNVGWPDFDVSPDGTKFLAIVPGPANQQPLTAVINFLEQAVTRSAVDR